MTDAATTPSADRGRVDDLRVDPTNRRMHPDRNVDMVRDALQEVGAARSIVIDEDDVVLAGNGVVAAAKAAGITSVRVIDSDGAELIAVRRSNLTPDQKRALAMYDNRTAELAEWNVDQLQADVREGLDLSPFFFDDELAAFWPDQRGSGMTLADRFGVPPFSVLDARQGYWQERKRAWLALGIQSELGRSDAVAAPGGSPRPGLRGPRAHYKAGGGLPTPKD
jgi:hypothetical protein